jgi:tetratricopeptide (TPR) repeat protein
VSRNTLLGRGYLASKTDSAADLALDAFDKAAAADSLSVEARLGRAEALFRKGTVERDTTLVAEALAACEDARRLDDGRAETYVLLGNVRSYLGRKEEAVRDFAAAIQRNPRRPDARRRLAWTHLELGQSERAEAEYKEAIEEETGYWGAYEDLGYLYYILGRYDDAAVQFRRVAALAPDYGPTYNYLGGIAYYQEDWVTAIEMFEKSFSLGRSYNACSNLGTLYFMKGRFEEAARMYEWAREYNPANHIVVGNLASAYYWMPEGRARAERLFGEAIQLAEGGLSQTPDDGLLLSFLAAYYALSDSAAAVRYADRALAVDGDNGEVLYRCASVYERLGRRARALVVLGDALKNGYSRKTLAHDRYFQELRKDSRYGLLVSEHTGAEG